MSNRQLFNTVALIVVFGSGLIIYGWNRWQGVDVTKPVPYNPPPLPPMEQMMPPEWQAEIKRANEPAEVVLPVATEEFDLQIDSATAADDVLIIEPATIDQSLK